MKKIKRPIALVSLYLLVFTLLPYTSAPVYIIFVMFALSPFAVLWMVYKILKHGEYKGGELKGEWGYGDYNP